MAKTFLIPVDFNYNAAQNFVLETLSSDPSSKPNGHSYYNSTTKQVRFRQDGTYRNLHPPYYIQIALTANGVAIAAKDYVAFARVPVGGTITGFWIDLDPGNEPATTSVTVDLNKVDRSTRERTSVLSSDASIATSANTGTGTISGTQTVSAGDLLSCDITQGDAAGKDLIATVEITPY